MAGEVVSAYRRARLSSSVCGWEGLRHVAPLPEEWCLELMELSSALGEKGRIARCILAESQQLSRTVVYRMGRWAGDDAVLGAALWAQLGRVGRMRWALSARGAEAALVAGLAGGDPWITAAARVGGACMPMSIEQDEELLVALWRLHATPGALEVFCAIAPEWEGSWREAASCAVAAVGPAAGGPAAGGSAAGGSAAA